MMIIRSAAAALVAAASVALPIRSRDHAPVPARRSFSEPDYSPGRREIAFVSGGDIWTVPAAGGEAHLLVSDASNDRRPLYSPDGSQLAFMSSRNGGSNIYVLALATGTLRRITFADGVDQLDSWSRDGKWILFTTTASDIAGMSDIARVSASGGTPVPIAADRYAADFWAAAGPDESTIAITARGITASQWWRLGHSHIDESEIWLVHGVAPGARTTPKYEQMTGPGAKSQWPMWSADGKTLYFVSDRSGAPNLYSRLASGGAEKQLTKFTEGRLLWPSIAYDGKGIVFERDFGIWSYDVASGAAKPVAIELRGSASGAVVEHRTLSNGLQELALSPDGKKVAFVVRGKIFAASSKDGGTGLRVSAAGLVQQQPAWAPDSRRLAFSDDREGQFHLYLYDFVTHEEHRLTAGIENDVTPVWSPDGKSLAFVRGGSELHVLSLAPSSKGAPAAQADRIVAHARLDRAPLMSERSIVWSPDSRWIAYATNQGSKLFANAQLVSVSGGESRPVSFLSNTNGDALGWSPDGTFLLLVTGQRTESGQLARVDLIPRTPRFREDQFRDLFSIENPSSAPPPRTQPSPGKERTPAPRDTAATHDSAASPATDSSTRASDSTHRDAVSHTPVVFEGLRSRLSFLPIGLDVVGEEIAPDGKSVVVTAVAAGQANLYLFPLDELSKEDPVAKQLTSTPGPKSSVQWSPDGKEVYYIESGRIAAIDVASRSVRPVSVSAEMDIDFTADRGELFTLIWRELRDNFFDEKMNGVDWNALREQYAPLAQGAQTPDELARLMNEMVGELNASHSGVRGPSSGAPFTGRLGIRLDAGEYERSGKLRISEIIPLGPVALAGKIASGDYIVAIDGVQVGARTNIDELLDYRIGKQTTLSVISGADTKPRIVTVLPVSTNTEKGLLYRAWVEQSRAYVARASGGRLGYVHMPDMSEESLQRLYADLDAQNQANDGVVIDIRNNNGGFVNAYALDVLTRAPYLTMQIRGFATAPARTLLGQRSLELPTVLVTNMHSLSDAEDFSEGYHAMKLGKIVGEPTAGWIIYTSNDVLFDGSSVRIPFIRIRAADGSDMELHPRPVDVAITRAMGESYGSHDTQLDAAVKTLLGQIGTARKAGATH
ncbi:MAG: PD40 domain-containing protein [Gemmatimonadaceae bacterium]|nr:PD40 domain-containing protein [Gemmatimonadaceae bacterium]